MSNITYLLTDTGIYKTDTDLTASSSTAVIESVECGTIVQDSTYPLFWYGSPSVWQWRLFNPKADADLDNNLVVGWKYMRSVQYDPMNGDAYFLIPFQESSSNGGNAVITKMTRASQTISTFYLTVDNVAINMFYVLDMKIDAPRRRLWVLDAGNQRIIRANLDTGSVEMTFSPLGFVAPCSMTVDLSNGKVYVHSLNASTPAEGNSSSSSFSSLSSMSASMSSQDVFPETIYEINGTDIQPIAEIHSSINYATYAPQPTSSDIDNIISTNQLILPPKSETMLFDSMRGKLWWSSKREERILFMMDTRDGTIQSVSLQSSLDYLDTISLNQDSGGILACGARGANGAIVSIDENCLIVYAYAHPSSSIINNAVIIQAANTNVVSFYATGIPEYSSAAPDVSSSSESNDDINSSESNDDINPAVINSSLIANSTALTGNQFNNDEGASSDSTQSYQSYGSEDWDDIAVATITTTSSPIVSVTTVSTHDSGVHSTRLWTTKDRPQDSQPVESAISIPLFSWSVSAAKGHPCMAVATSSGDLVKISYQDRVLAEQGRCSSPVGDSITGLSVSNGNGNTYVSGQGKIAKINFDPTTPGDYAELYSSSSSSSQSPSDNVGWNAIPVSSIISDSGAGGISVQFHNKQIGNCAISEQEGKVFVFDDLQGWSNKQTFSPLPAPFKAVWLSGLSSIVVACRNSIYVVNPESEDIKQAYGVPDFDVMDVCCSANDIGISVSSTTRKTGMFKVMAADLSTNRLTYLVTGGFPSTACFDLTGKVFIAIEETNNNRTTTKFVAANVGGTPSQRSQAVEGKVSSMIFDENFDVVFALFTSGVVVTLNYDGSSTCAVTQVGVLADEISFAKGSLVAGISPDDVKQSKVRVIVGSKEGSSDRWDSGEVTTSSSRMFYGGGDNLEPGEAYWVSISVMDSSGSWSAPANTRFVVPVI